MEYDNKHKTVQTTLEQIFENCNCGISDIVGIDKKSLTIIDTEPDVNSIFKYRGIKIIIHNKRFTILENSDLLDLGLCTTKNIRSGRRGLSTRKRLIRQIDAAMDYKCTHGGSCSKDCSICMRDMEKK